MFVPPTETEFLERGFSRSLRHDPDEGELSFVRFYPGERELTHSLVLGSDPSLHVSLNERSAVPAEVLLEPVSELSFQSWHGAQTIRVYLRSGQITQDLRVHYSPEPSIHYTRSAVGPN